MNLLAIVSDVARLVELNPRVHAMWIEGSYATGRQTVGSDIDVWLDVDDGTFDECVADFRKKLSRVVPIARETSRGIYSEDPRLTKHIFVLAGFPEGEVVELDLQEHSRDFAFLSEEHVVYVLFDRDGTIRWTT